MSAEDGPPSLTLVARSEEAPSGERTEGCTAAAVYLVGQGPQREPRPIELQWARVLRYRDHLRDEGGERLDPLSVYCDLNCPRRYSMTDEDFPGLAHLLRTIAEGKVHTVLVDVANWDEVERYGFDYGMSLLRSSGARVINVVSPEDRVVENALLRRYGDDARLLFPDGSSGEFLALFPSLAASIIQEFVQLYVYAGDRSAPSMNRLLTALNFLGRENPWARSAGRVPVFSAGAWNRFAEVSGRKQEHEMAERRLTEPLFRVHPDQSAILLDEHLGEEARSSAALEWAIHRLVGDLQFDRRVEDRVQSLQRTVGDLQVWADPRRQGRIDFLVFRLQPAAAKVPARPGRAKPPAFVGLFHLMDSWTRNLEAKFLARVEKSARIAREGR